MGYVLRHYQFQPRFVSMVQKIQGAPGGIDIFTSSGCPDKTDLLQDSASELRVEL